MSQENLVQFRKAATLLEIRQQPGEETDDRKYYRARISSDELDSHYSMMDISTLENFARESAQGVAVLDSHNHRTVGIGRSISGELIDNEVYSNFYILKELDLNNQSFRTSDSFMKAIDSGMLQDVSVGFYGHSEICQICHEELWRGSCFHWPGMSYIIEEDGKKEIKVCTTLIVDGHLSEFSLVYDGALEGASIVEKSLAKAQRIYDAEGGLTDEQKNLLNTRHQIQFKSGKAIYEGQVSPNEPIVLSNKLISNQAALIGADPNKSDLLGSDDTKLKNSDPVGSENKTDLVRSDDEESKKMNNEEKLTQEIEELKSDIKELKAINERLKTENEDIVTLKVELETLRDRNDTLEGKFKDKNEMIDTLYQEKTELKQKLEELMPIVEEGKQARVEAELDALLEWNRMNPDSDDEEEANQKEFLKHLPDIKQVRNFKNNYAKLAEKLYPSGQKTNQPPAQGTDPKDDEDNEGRILRPFEPGADAF